MYREDFFKLDDDAPAEALALISLSFFLIARTVDSFLLNFLQRDVNLSPDFNRSRISNSSFNDINLLLGLSFLEIFGDRGWGILFLISDVEYSEE